MKSITLLLSLLILSTCNISYAAVDIFLTSERYPNATTLEVDIHIRDQSSNFDLGGNTTNFTLSTINFSYSTFGTGAGQLSVKTGTPTHHLTGYGVSVSAPSDGLASINILYTGTPGSEFEVTSSYQDIITLAFDLGANTFTSHQFTLTPVASTTVHDINANVINDGSFSGFSNESLPVELVSLQGRKHNESIKIDWETAMEEQNEGFYVERSYNGLEFEQIDFIPGNGFSTEAILYEYLDHHFDQSAEVVYYRLKQLDFDGKIEYSHVISVRNKNIDDDGSLEISVFPNPANSEVIITASDKVNLRVLGTSGNVLFESYNANGALVDLSAFAKGFYIVEAFSDDNSVIKREKLIVE